MTSTALRPYRQTDAAIRFDWGLQGASCIAQDAVAVIVIDVLSFTTTLSVATDLGIQVFPYRFRDASAAAFAASRGAVLAIGRREAGPGGVSLSPLSVRQAATSGPLVGGGKLVLPSPNGSAICRQLAEGGSLVVAACLRNARAVASWVRMNVARGPVAVVAAGERWPGDQLRPAVEDLWGAGAVIAALMEGDRGVASPEAQAAASAFRQFVPNVAASLRACASGQELIADGFGDEIAVAAELNASSKVPVLQGELFRAG